MKCKRLVLWWLVNGNNEPARLTVADKKIETLMPLVNTLFPGINYYSVTGFGQVMIGCVIPVLKKRFPELTAMPDSAVAADDLFGEERGEPHRV